MTKLEREIAKLTKRLDAMGMKLTKLEDEVKKVVWELDRIEDPRDEINRTIAKIRALEFPGEETDPNLGDYPEEDLMMGAK